LPENSRAAKAVDVLVYVPLGFVAYLRDTGPSFVELFVARGRKEFDGARRTVETKLGLRQPEPAPSVAQRMTDSIGKFAAQAAAQAGGVVAAFTTPPTAPAPEPPPAPEPMAPSDADPAPPASDLAIPGYDMLSASQVVERLEGLSPAALASVRAYELAHRARNTILGKIDQLTG
jgi:hypothetical protein